MNVTTNNILPEGLRITHNNSPEALQAIYDDLQLVKNLLQQRTVNQTQDEIFTVDECAAFLNLQKQTVYQLVSERKIPVIKKGKKLRFLKADILTWLKSSSRKVKPQAA